MPALSVVISTLADIAEALAVVIAVGTLVLGRREAKHARDLELFLSLSDSFRTRWEASWEDILDAIGADHRGDGLRQVPVEYQKELRHMLNWVDWLGTIMETGTLANEHLIFGSIGITIKRILNASRPLIEGDVQTYGLVYWKSLCTVGRRLHVPWVEALFNPLPPRQVSIVRHDILDPFVVWGPGK